MTKIDEFHMYTERNLSMLSKRRPVLRLEKCFYFTFSLQSLGNKRCLDTMVRNALIMLKQNRMERTGSFLILSLIPLLGIISE